jgi:hypothetical protein
VAVAEEAQQIEEIKLTRNALLGTEYPNVKTDGFQSNVFKVNTFQLLLICSSCYSDFQTINTIVPS